MTRNDEIRRLLDTLLATRADAVSPFQRDRARADAAMTLAYDCDELLGSIVPALLAENEEQARRIENLRGALCTIADRAGEGARGSDRFGYEYMHRVAVKALGGDS